MRSRVPAGTGRGGASSDVIVTRGIPRQSSVSPPLPIIDSDLDSEDIASCIDPDSIDLIVTESDSNGFWGLSDDATTTEFQQQVPVNGATCPLQQQQQQLVLLQAASTGNGGVDGTSHGQVFVASGILPPSIGCLAVTASASDVTRVHPMVVDDEVSAYTQQRHLAVSDELVVVVLFPSGDRKTSPHHRFRDERQSSAAEKVK